MSFALPVFGRLRKLHARYLREFLRGFVCQPMTVSEATALVVAPHPDDETLGCGGLIALKRAAGATVQIVFLTDGSAGRGSPANTRENFMQLRKQEARRAAEILGVDRDRVSFLDIADTTLRDTESAKIAVEQLAALLIAHRPEEIYVPHRRDCHPDHEAAWRITRTVLQRTGSTAKIFQYPIWLLWSAPLLLRLFPRHLAGARRLRIKSVQAQKQRAIAAYDSQCATLPPGFLEQFLEPDEFFFVPNQP